MGKRQLYIFEWQETLQKHGDRTQAQAGTQGGMEGLVLGAQEGAHGRAVTAEVIKDAPQEVKVCQHLL